MKKILLTLLTLLLSCSCAIAKTTTKHKPSITIVQKKNNNIAASIHKKSICGRIRARVTYYCAEFPFGSHVAQPGVKKAIAGKTIAAHPAFKFGTKVYIPNLSNDKFVVQDRGSAITRGTASKGKSFVFDVFCRNRSEMNRFARLNSEYMDVIITN